MHKFVTSWSNFNVQNTLNVYTIIKRFPHKPSWIGPAKTKMFVNKEKRYMPPGEEKELTKLRQTYMVHYQSLKALIDEVHKANETSEEVLAKIAEEKKIAWEEAMQINDAWNAEIAIERERKDNEEFEAAIRDAQRTVLEEETTKKEMLERVEAEIQKQKEASRHYVTRDNIDDHIRNILDSPPQDFFFAIDRKRRIYPGLSSNAAPQEDEAQDTSAEDKVEKLS